MKFIENTRLYAYKKGKHECFQIMEMTSKLVMLKSHQDKSVTLVLRKPVFETDFWRPEGQKIIA